MAVCASLADLGGRHVVAVEDPVEQIIPGIMQTEVNKHAALLSRKQHALLRQDPQVLVIGEIRDEETANLAVRAALTGHQVISTLHAGSCQGVFERLLAICADKYAVTSAVDLILNQRLLRRVCEKCQGAGCAACLQTGYHGRVPAVEWMRMDENLRSQLRSQGPATLKPASRLETCARDLWQQGVTTEAEFCRIFGP
jgi:type II secretory ATPase GspE/PulE/Tfp pilus assembly ATPase PilB-like protein